MQLMYLFVVVNISIFFIFRKKIDMFLLWFAGMLAMSPPYLTGQIYIPPLINSPEKINIISYIIMLLILLVLFFSTVYYDNRYKKSSHVYLNEFKIFNRLNSFSTFIAILAILFFIVSVYFVGIDKISSRRVSSDLNALESGLISKTILFSMYATFLGFYSRNKLALSVGVVILFANYSISPSRSYLFITALSILMVILIPKGKLNLPRLFKYSILILSIIAFVVFGKVYREFNMGLLDAIKHFISLTFEGDRVTFREANYVAANLLVSTETVIAFEKLERLAYYPLMIFPFLYLVFIAFFDLKPLVMYSTIVSQMHGFDRFGIGSSLWGEIYAVGGLFLIVLVSLVFSYIVMTINRKFYQNKISVLSLMMFIPTIYIVAYANRLDVTLLLNRFSEAILIYIFYLFYTMLKFRNNK